MGTNGSGGSSGEAAGDRGKGGGGEGRKRSTADKAKLWGCESHRGCLWAGAGDECSAAAGRGVGQWTVARQMGEGGDREGGLSEVT